MTDIAIVDYGMGNLRSVSKALEHVAPAASIAVTDDPEVVRKAGVSWFPAKARCRTVCMNWIERGLREAVLDAAMSKPFLGICIGLQMLFDSSEEGNVKGLGIVPGKVRRFPSTAMAEDTNGQKAQSAAHGLEPGASDYRASLMEGYPQRCALLFRAQLLCRNRQSGTGSSIYLYPFPFTCAVAKDNIFAVQFHPEKSHEAGLTLLSNFVQWKPVSGNG